MSKDKNYYMDAPIDSSGVADINPGYDAIAVAFRVRRP